MGLIKTALDSITGTLSSQTLSFIKCQDMGNEILMVKKTEHNGIIRNGSRIIVNPGQMVVLVDNGRVLDASAEQGVFEFDSSASPSFFTGSFVENAKGSFKEMWQRFTFGGTAFHDQAIYFMNTTEILNNGFGTPSPVMYKDWGHTFRDVRHPDRDTPMRVALKCAGVYSFMIDRPDIFLKRIAGTASMYHKDEICEQMRMEIISCFQAILNSLCSEQNKIEPLEIPQHAYFIKQLMDAQAFDGPIRERGMKIASFNVAKVDLDDESKKKIDEYERTGDAATQQAKLTSAAMLAADNAGGAGVGFMNLHMMNSAMGTMMPNTMPTPTMAQAGQQMHAQQMAPAAAAMVAGTAAAQAGVPMQQGVTCTNCGMTVQGKFCANCGTPAPVATAKFCPNCGTKANGKFCAQCGTPIG